MQAKSVLYAAVGAPVVAARKVGEQVSGLKDRVSKESATYSEAANKTIDGWAAEGEKVIARIGDGKVVEEISQKVDLDQAKEQVTKLRDQLEDMLATWRTSFRPEKADDSGSKPAGEAKTGTKTTSAKGTTAKKSASSAKPAAKKASGTSTTSAAKTTSAKSGKSSTATKASSAKTEAAKAQAS